MGNYFVANEHSRIEEKQRQITKNFTLSFTLYFSVKKGLRVEIFSKPFSNSFLIHVKFQICGTFIVFSFCPTK